MYALARMAWPAVCWPVLFSRALVAFKAFRMVTWFFETKPRFFETKPMHNNSLTLKGQIISE